MKIVWLNNVQAPYREPMVVELANQSDFRAAYFFRHEPEHHWNWRPHPGYRSEVVPSWRLPIPRRLSDVLVDQVGVLRPGVARRVVEGADALITQVWWQPAHLQAILACRRRNIPYLIYAESTMDSRSVRGGLADRLRNWVFRNAGAVVVPGPAAAEAAVENGTPRDRVVESVNSVDVSLYRDGVRELRSVAPSSPGEPHRFAFVGRLVDLKNVDSLLQAFARLDGEPLLEIAGDGAEEPRLRALCAELGITDRVSFLGYLDEQGVLELLARSRSLVLPSTKEVYGYVALEAFVAGLQVIVSDQAGISRNLGGRPGVWVVTPTPENLAAAMGEARARWDGWQYDVDTEFASPRRVAADIVSAAELAAFRVSNGRVLPSTPRGSIDQPDPVAAGRPTPPLPTSQSRSDLR